MVSYHAKDPTALGLSVSALVWRDEQILLMQRADNGLWGLPGGFVEVGESVAEAARREVEEETGWTADIGRLIGVYSDPSQQVVDYGPRTRGPITGQATAREARPGAVSAGGVEGAARRGGRIQIVNLCFHAQAIAEGEPTTPEETLAIGFFGTDALPEPFVPIHVVRIEDGLAGRIEASVR